MSEDNPVMMPCPFCGGIDTQIAWNEYQDEFVMCNNCQCCGPAVKESMPNSGLEANKKWNTRVFMAEIGFKAQSEEENKT